MKKNKLKKEVSGADGGALRKFEFSLFSLKETSVLKLESSTNEGVNFVLELLSIFAKDIGNLKRQLSIDALQRNTESLRNKIYTFVENNKNSAPGIYNLKVFIDTLDENEFFYFFRKKDMETSQTMEIFNQLEAINKTKSFAEINSPFNEPFGFVLNNYNVLAYEGDKPAYIGEADKKKRVCRFCGKTQPTVSFKKKAHAISEALGNKSIVLNEECNSCNARFGSGIENDIVSFLSIYRSYFGIKGKTSGFPMLKGSDFSIQSTSDGSVNLKFKAEHGNGIHKSIPMKTNESFTPQNIYRALCKFVISVLATDELEPLQKTVKWINGEYNASELPKVRMQMIPSFFSKYPSITVYFRKNNLKESPHIIGEFKFAHLIFVFVVPFSSRDEKQFVDDEGFNYFWERFHYSKGEVESQWKTFELSSPEKRKLVFNANFQANKNL